MLFIVVVVVVPEIKIDHSLGHSSLFAYFIKALHEYEKGRYSVPHTSCIINTPILS